MSGFYQHHHQFNNKQPDFASGISETSGENLMVPSSTWQENNNTRDHHQLLVDDGDDDDTSLRSCVFPCQGNERPSQGLSLSLSSSNPSTIGLQSFELIRHATDNSSNPNNQEEMRFMDSCSIRSDVGFFGKPTISVPPPPVHQQIILQGHQFDLRSCKYLGPAQELLNEFCGLDARENDVPKRTQKQKQLWEEENGSTSSSSSRKQYLHSLEFVDLQKRKRNLLSMLEEVERRYRHYCDQMKAVVSSFESVAGAGAAGAYSSLASKAMSKHFRCLKDGIVAQIHATKKGMGEKDPVAPGTSRGETPRLRVLDQALRQQRAFQQMSMIETHPWRPQRGLPERSVSVLRAWLFEHFLHPYPSDVDKHILARQTGLSRSQVSNWFINARVRLWKPMVEEMYMEESKDGLNERDDDIDGRPNTQTLPSTDQKPTPDQLQLVRIDSECLSSIISNPDKNDSSSNRGPPNKGFHGHHDHHPAGFGAFGVVELDFSSYNQSAEAGVSFAHHNESTSVGAHGHNFNGGGDRVGGAGVSLTLGLQQHGASGVSLAFSPASQSSLYFTRNHIEDCQPGQYSILDGEGQNLPYGNLMGAQLLHDLAG